MLYIWKVGVHIPLLFHCSVPLSKSQMEQSTEAVYKPDAA